MPQNSWASLGTTDPRDHRDGWRYVMVEVSSVGFRLRQLAGPGSRVGRAVPVDPFAADPNLVEAEPAALQRYESKVRYPEFKLIDEAHPPRSAGLIVTIPDDRVWLNSTGWQLEDGDHIMRNSRPGRPASGLNGLSLGPGTQILGVVVPEYDQTHECHTEQHDTGGPGSSWDAEWAERLGEERGVPVIRTHGSNPVSYDRIVDIEPLTLVHDPLGWSVRVPEAPGDFDMSLSYRATHGGEEGLYPLTGDDAFRRGERRALLLSPGQIAWALEALATAGVPEAEVAAVAASYERTIDENEAPRVTGSRSGPEKVPFAITANSGYGPTEMTLTINSDGAFRKSRQHPEPGPGPGSAEDPEKVLAVIEDAKRRHPDDAQVIDALYQYIRARNAAEWATLETYNGVIPRGRVAKAQRFAGVPLNDELLQQAAKAKSDRLRRAVDEVTRGSDMTIVYDTPDSPAELDPAPPADWRQLLEAAVGTNPASEEPPSAGSSSAPRRGGAGPIAGHGRPGAPGASAHRPGGPKKRSQ